MSFFYCLWWLPREWRVCLKHERGDKGAKDKAVQFMWLFILFIFLIFRIGWGFHTWKVDKEDT